MKRGFVFLRNKHPLTFQKGIGLRAAQAVCLALRVDECVDGNC